MNEELINKLNPYEVWNIHKYVNYSLNVGASNNIKEIKESFKQLSKGFNFIIAVYQESNTTKGYVFFSVPFFNDKVIGNG